MALGDSAGLKAVEAAGPEAKDVIDHAKAQLEDLLKSWRIVISFEKIEPIAK